MKTNDTLKNSLNQWQDFAQAYTDFVFDTTEQALKTSLALRERTGKLMGETLKQTQALAAEEQAAFPQRRRELAGPDADHHPARGPAVQSPVHQLTTTSPLFTP